MRLLTLFCLLALSLGAQTILRVPSGGPPYSLDPHTQWDGGHLRYFAQIFESPLECVLDDDGRAVLEPAITSLPKISKNGLTIELEVRPGIYFHDDRCFKDGKGREVTAADVRYMFLRHADPESGSRFWSYLEGQVMGLDAWRTRCEAEKLSDYDLSIDGLKVDGRKVVLKLSRPYPVLPALLSQPWASVVCPEAIRRYGSGFAERPVGTGPFRFVERDALGTVKLLRHPRYRTAGLPRVDELRIDVATHGSKQLDRFFAGTLHLVDTFTDHREAFYDSRGRWKRRLTREGIRPSEGAPLQVNYLCFNLENRFLAIPEIRRAIHLAIDREKVIETQLAGRGIIADSPVPPVFPEASAIEGRGYELAVQDPGGARKLLEKAGFPEGKGLPEFIFDCPGGDEDAALVKAAESIIGDLAKVGIRAQIRAEPYQRFYQSRAKDGSFQIVMAGWFADYPDVENFLLLFRSAGEDGVWGYNYGRYRNPEVDALYEQIAGLYPTPFRTGLVADIVTMIRKDIPWVPLFFPRSSMAMQKGVSGYRFNVLNYSLKDVVIQSDSKK